ncbi:putative formamidopyrimidine-DNA glycosylase, partial [Trichinella spiralis]|uniref:putative formamidopyrimidine-DNA glycosylase n=1 Tax=Trichinella spiralis TaxID=6334 RepID=UPI0001EFD793
MRYPLQSEFEAALTAFLLGAVHRFSAFKVLYFYPSALYLKKTDIIQYTREMPHAEVHSHIDHYG